MAGFWENLIASFILAWRGYDPDNFNPRRQETRISLVLRADGKAYLKYLWALQYGVAWGQRPALHQVRYNVCIQNDLAVAHDRLLLLGLE